MAIAAKRMKLIPVNISVYNNRLSAYSSRKDSANRPYDHQVIHDGHEAGHQNITEAVTMMFKIATGSKNFQPKFIS